MESELKRRLSEKGLELAQEKQTWNEIIDVISLVLGRAPRTTETQTSYDNYNDGDGTTTGGSRTRTTTR